MPPRAGVLIVARRPRTEFRRREWRLHLLPDMRSTLSTSPSLYARTKAIRATRAALYGLHSRLRLRVARINKIVRRKHRNRENDAVESGPPPERRNRRGFTISHAASVIGNDPRVSLRDDGRECESAWDTFQRWFAVTFYVGLDLRLKARRLTQRSAAEPAVFRDRNSPRTVASADDVVGFRIVARRTCFSDVQDKERTGVTSLGGAHELRRGRRRWGEVVDSRGRVLSRDDTGVIAGAHRERDIARRESDGNGRWKEIRKWPVKVLECARGHVDCRISERAANGLPSLLPNVGLHLPSPVAASYSRVVPDQSTAGWPLYFPSVPWPLSPADGGEWARPEKPTHGGRFQWRTRSRRRIGSFLSIPPIFLISREFPQGAAHTHLRDVRLYGASFTRTPREIMHRD